MPIVKKLQKPNLNLKKVHNQVTTYRQYNTPGLNGKFWSWLKKAVNTIVNALQMWLPAPVHAILDDFTNGDGQFNPFNVFNVGGTAQRFNNTTDLELTALDEANLDNWLENNFKPYYSQLVQVINNYKNSTPTVEEFIVFYNEVNIFIGYLNAQIALDRINGVDGLSANAVESRNIFLEIQRDTLKELLKDYADSKGLDLFTRKATINLNTVKYSSVGFDSPATMTVSYQEVATLNGTTIDYTEVNQTDTPINTVTDPGNNSGSNNNNYKVVRNIALIAIGTLAVRKLVN